MANDESNPMTYLDDLIAQFEVKSIAYHNLRDRQSFRNMGIISGILLALIGIFFAPGWLLKILLFVCGLLISLGSFRLIKKVDPKELEVLLQNVNQLQEKITMGKMEIRRKKKAGDS